MKQRRFTVEEYHRMGETGILVEDEHVELIHGAIIVSEPIGARHAGTVNRLTRLFISRLGDRAVAPQPQRGGTMANSMTDRYLDNNKQYASGQAMHKPAYPGKQPIQPAKRVAVVACMDARLDVEDLLGLQTGDAHVIRNAGGVVSDDTIRCLIISHHLLNTNEIILIHHTRCGMLAFTDDLLKAGLEGDPAAEKLLGQATGRAFMSCKRGAATPSSFHAFRGQIEPLDAPRDAKQTERLAWDVRRGMSSILNHPWIPTNGPDAVTVRGFLYDVDTGKLEEVSYPGPMGSIS